MVGTGNFVVRFIDVDRAGPGTGHFAVRMGPLAFVGRGPVAAFRDGGFPPVNFRSGMAL